MYNLNCHEASQSCVRQSMYGSQITAHSLRVTGLHKGGYYYHTSLLFLNSGALKIIDLVERQTAQIMYKARNKLRPCHIQ